MIKIGKDRAQIAMKYPIRSTLEMMHPALKKVVHLGNLQITSLFTIDCLEGNPKWHVSAAPLPLAPYGSREVIAQDILDVMFAHAAKLLEKVGTGEMYGTPPTNFIHVFRALSAAELAKIKKNVKRGH